MSRKNNKMQRPGVLMSLRRRMPQFVIIVVIFLTAAIGIITLTGAHAETPDSAVAESQEWEILGLINKERAANNLQPLKMQLESRDYARFHAKEMRTAGKLWHDLAAYQKRLPTTWRSIGENIGYDWSVASIHKLLMNSPPHKANILNAKFNYAGIGIAYTADGTLYLSEDFMENPSTVKVVASPPAPIPGDTNNDRKVNAVDLSILISHDGQNYPAADFNKDGTVGAADLSIMLSKWTW